MSVALEHEAKRRSKKRKAAAEAEEAAEEEAEDDNGVEDDNIYSLDELTKIKSVEEEAKKAAGPSVDQQELIKAKAEEDNKALLDAYWQFVKANPQDFTGWTYLLQVQTFYPQNGICNQKYYFWPKNDSTKWS